MIGYKQGLAWIILLSAASPSLSVPTTVRGALSTRQALELDDEDIANRIGLKKDFRPSYIARPSGPSTAIAINRLVLIDDSVRLIGRNLCVRQRADVSFHYDADRDAAVSPADVVREVSDIKMRNIYKFLPGSMSNSSKLRLCKSVQPTAYFQVDGEIAPIDLESVALAIFENANLPRYFCQTSISRNAVCEKYDQIEIKLGNISKIIVDRTPKNRTIYQIRVEFSPDGNDVGVGPTLFFDVGIFQEKHYRAVLSNVDQRNFIIH